LVIKKTEKKIMSKGYAIMNSKRVYIVESINGNKTVLDTGRKDFFIGSL
jgi:hypothetical protein